VTDTDEETLQFKTEGFRVPAGSRVHCSRRPQHPPFLWQRFEIKDPALWTIFNVAIGNNSLFKQNLGGGEGVSAPRLNEAGLLYKDVCRAAQDFTIVAMYIGPDPEGAEFECDVIGRVPR
jgi:hypothetical protein